MRQLYIFDRQSEAQTLADAMYTDGIEASVKPTRDERFGLWVHDDDDLESAREILEVYRLSPEDPRFAARASEARAAKKAQARADEQLRKRSMKIKRELQGSPGTGNVTKFLILACVGFGVMASLLDGSGQGQNVFRHLTFFDFRGSHRLFQDLLEGEIWRLVTPIFVYPGLPSFRGVLHIFFDMWWLKTLASPVESVFRGRFLLGFVVGAATVTGLAEAVLGSPLFGGMAGVVASLFAYLYVLERVDLSSPLRLPQGLAFWMILWTVLSLATGRFVALQLAGFAYGAAFAYIHAQLRMHRR